MSSDAIGQVLIGLCTGGAIVALIGWLRFRGTDRATEQGLVVTARHDEVSTLREVIAELRQLRADDRTRLDQLDRRVALLEERERHALTRAAVHEAWDQLAFAALTAQDPSHPPPPPLTEATRARDARNEREARDERNDREDRDARNAAEDRAARDARERFENDDRRDQT